MFPSSHTGYQHINRKCSNKIYHKINLLSCIQGCGQNRTCIKRSRKLNCLVRKSNLQFMGMFLRGESACTVRMQGKSGSSFPVHSESNPVNTPKLGRWPD